LEFLHSQRLIHRDIKPSNIIFVRGAPKLADIGLVTEIATSGTEATYIGTHGYIAPEGPGRPGADIYSLGRVLYEAWTGLHNEQYPRMPDTLMQRPDRELLIDLNEIILKACQREPAERYSSAAEMHADLEKLQRKHNSQLRPPG
jgi:serine/threonine protein kinase